MANKDSSKGIKALLGCELEIECKACKKYGSCLLKAVEISSLKLPENHIKPSKKPWVIEIE
ncbi:MAG: hypothetical protein QXX79_02875 [Candidatus Bathyarchaeia archaeon]